MILRITGISRIDSFLFFGPGFFYARPVGEDTMNTQEKNRLLTIGEDLQILNPKFQQVIERRDREGLIALADKQVKGGAMALDVNLGPSKSLAGRLTWVMEAIQSQWNVPLLLPAGGNLEKALQHHQGRATINAVTADPERLDPIIALARDYNANLVVLLTKPGLWTAGNQQQLHLALNVLERSDAIGLPLDNLYLDPVFSVRTDPMTWSLSGGMPDLDRVLELISFIGELTDQRAGTILALSNGTLGLPAQKRSALHCRMLPLLIKAGLRAVILNCRDKELMKVARSPDTAARLCQKAA